jgi:hypothetical protein
MKPTKPPTSCPLCDGEIELGSVSVHGTLVGFLFVGFSLQHCWFKARNAKEKIVLNSRGRKSGFRCKACGFVGMYGKESPL